MRAHLRRRFDEIYQLVADMGGAGYNFIGDKDANVMHNFATIHLNIVEAAGTSRGHSGCADGLPTIA